MLDTIEEKKAFLASSEMSYDPLYMKDMDLMYHYWMQGKWKETRAKWNTTKQTQAG